MKNIKRRIIIGSALFVALWTAQTTSAWYEPSTGRWLTRDPVGEPGFEVLRRAQAVPQPASTASSPGRWIHRNRPDNENRYVFVRNNPVNGIDPEGLKCVLMSNGMVADTDKGQVVFWSSDPVATANFIAQCNLKNNWPLIGACLLFFGYDPGPGQETCSLANETMGYCIYKCPSGAIRVTVAGPLGCVDTKNFPKPTKDDLLFPAK